MKDETKLLKAINYFCISNKQKYEIIVLNYFKDNLNKMKYKIIKDSNGSDYMFCFWVNEILFHITKYKSSIGEIVYNFDVMNFFPYYNEYEKDKSKFMRIFKIDKLLKENK